MLRSEHLLSDSQRAFAKCARTGEVALGLKKERKVGQARRRIRVLWAENLFADQKCTLEKRPGRGKVTLALKQAGEVVEARRRARMLWAENLLPDRERAPGEWPRSCEFALIFQ